MNKQFVSYKIAVKLKEKGFDEPCIAYYNNDTLKYMRDAWLGTAFDADEAFTIDNKNCNDEEYTAPLWQQAFDWILQKLEETNSEQYNRRWSYILCSDNTGAWDYGNGDGYYSFLSKEEGILLGLSLKIMEKKEFIENKVLEPDQEDIDFIFKKEREYQTVEETTESFNNTNKYSENDILKALIWMASSNWELTSTGWVNLKTKENINDTELLNKFKEHLPRLWVS